MNNEITFRHKFNNNIRVCGHRYAIMSNGWQYIVDSNETKLIAKPRREYLMWPFGQRRGRVTYRKEDFDDETIMHIYRIKKYFDNLQDE